MSDGEACWRFIGRVYGTPGVQEACLELQEQLDIDIVLLLFAGWLSSGGIALSREEAEAAAALVGSWREQAIKPLRRIRTELRASPMMMARPGVSALRERIKADELAAERIELDMLVEWARARRPSDARSDEALVAHNLAACLPAAAGAAHTSSDASLRTLAAACLRQIEATARGD